MNSCRFRNGIIAVLVIIVAYLFSHKIPPANNKKAILYKDVEFSSQKIIKAGVPNSVLFNYDISKIDIKKAVIQQSWDESLQADILPENKHHTSIYYYPGYHNAKLLINGAVIKEHGVHIKTDGWLALVRYCTP